jgi:hypothetical protein
VKTETSVKGQVAAKTRVSDKGQPSAKPGKNTRSEAGPGQLQVPVATDSRRGKTAPSNENITTGTPRGLIQQPETLAQKRMAGERSAATRQMVDTKGLKVRAEGVKQAPHTRAVNNRGQ